MKKIMLLSVLVGMHLCVNGMEEDKKLIDKTLVALEYVKNFNPV